MQPVGSDQTYQGTSVTLRFPEMYRLFNPVMGDLAVQGRKPVHLKLMPLNKTRKKNLGKGNFKSFVVILIHLLFDLTLE